MARGAARRGGAWARGPQRAPLPAGLLGLRFNLSAPPKIDPQMMIAFTCNKCDTRLSHTMLKQAYTRGTVLIQCPECKVRHLIADHLKIFDDKRVTIQDLLAAKGETVSTSLADLEFKDIPESLKGTLGRYAKDGPYEEDPDGGLLEGKKE